MISPSTVFVVLLGLSAAAYYVGRRRALAVAGNLSKVRDLHSRPSYYGSLTALWCGIPALLLFGFWLVLALMTLPVIIISGRSALKSVPPSIREAALGVGASKMQMIAHHVLPLALPGILTGTIIGMARALGETAPLLMIGMVAFIVDIPQGLFDPSTVLPVQIFLWADSPERAFVERTSAAILVLLGFLITMNAGAVLLRKNLKNGGNRNSINDKPR